MEYVNNHRGPLPTPSGCSSTKVSISSSHRTESFATMTELKFPKFRMHLEGCLNFSFPSGTSLLSVLCLLISKWEGLNSRQSRISVERLGVHNHTYIIHTPKNVEKIFLSDSSSIGVIDGPEHDSDTYLWC